MKLEVISRAPAVEMAGRPHLLFVHGAFHTAGCWDEHYLPWFADEGWHAHAVSLRGHGASEGVDRINGWTLADYADDVVQAISEIGAPCVLIGHSMGGVVAQMCFNGGTPGVAGLIMFASSPLRISPAVGLRILLRHPVSLIAGQVFGRMDMAMPAFTSFFYSPDLPPADRARYIAALSSESQKAVDEIFKRDEPVVAPDEARPVLVVAGANDWSIPMQSQKWFAARYHAPLEVIPGYHDMMLDPLWKPGAAAIDAWLKARFGGGSNETG